MVLCLKCHKISPAGSRWCQFGCGSFGGARCPKDHLVPVSAGQACCPTCGSSELSSPVGSANLRPATRAVAWAGVLFGVHVALTHVLQIGGFVLPIAGSVAGRFLGVERISPVWVLDHFLAFLLVFAAGCKLVGRPFGPTLAAFIEWASRLLFVVLRWAAVAVYWLAEGGRPATRGRKDRDVDGTT